VSSLGRKGKKCPKSKITEGKKILRTESARKKGLLFRACSSRTGRKRILGRISRGRGLRALFLKGKKVRIPEEKSVARKKKALKKRLANGAQLTGMTMTLS